MAAEHQDDVRLEHAHLSVEELAARLHLLGFRVTIAGRPALDDIGDVDVAAVQTRRLQQASEQLAGGAHEWLALAVLGLAWPLTDGHDPCRHRTVPRHGLDARLVERARG